MNYNELDLLCVCEGNNLDCKFCEGRGQIPLKNYNSILLNLRNTKYYNLYSNPDKFNNFEIVFLSDDFLPESIKIRIVGKSKIPKGQDVNETYVFSLKTPLGLVDYSIGVSFHKFQSKFRTLIEYGILKDKFQFEIEYDGIVEQFNNSSKGYSLVDNRFILIEYFNFFKRKLFHHIK